VRYTDTCSGFQNANGNYFRQFELNEDIDGKHSGALMMNGVLELTLPKGEPTWARRIEVRAG
jgi:HSP20 family molecular chaperone IbpA